MKKTITYKAYNKMALDYFDFVDTNPWNAYLERPNMLKLISNPKDLTILDAGCAAGWYTKKLLDLKAKKVVGLDYNKKMIFYANKRLENYCKSSYKFYLQDLTKPFKKLSSKSFDMVVNSLAIHYIKDISIVLSEFSRVLKKDGTLIISTGHPIMEYNYFKRKNYYKTKQIKDIWQMNKKDVEVSYYTRSLSELINPIINAGFMITEILEGKPNKEFKKANEKIYEELMKKPHFLFIKAKKI